MGVRVAGPGRLLFGSDYPLESHSGATVGELVEMVRSLPLEPAEREAILGGNAGALFGIA